MGRAITKKTRTQTIYLNGLEVSQVQGGFMSVALLSWILFLGTALMGLTVTYYSLIQLTLANSACRQSVLETQEKLKGLLDSLLALNPQAEALRLKKINAERALKVALATSHPVTIAAARANLARVLAAQLALRAKQTQLRLLAQSHRQKVVQKIREHSPNLKFSSLTKRAHFYLGVPTKETPTHSLSPNHEPMDLFSERQKLSLKWQVNLVSIAPHWLKTKLNSFAHLKGQCAATLTKKEGQWITHLAADKYY